MVTPARNECEMLPSVIESVSASSKIPSIWVIVDDNSTDCTEEVLDEYSRILDYVRILTLRDDSVRDLDYRYSEVCIRGFRHCVTEASLRDVDWEYIALLDADTVVPPHYFEQLIDKMENDPLIGIASGNVNIMRGKDSRAVYMSRDRPSGTARMWRRECFEEAGAYHVTPAPDSVSTIKARLNGWKTVRFSDLEAYQLRETSSADSLWKGYSARGRTMYYMNCGPILMIVRFLLCLTQRRFYLAVPLFLGYFESAVNRRPKSADREIGEYFRKGRFREVLKGDME